MAKKQTEKAFGGHITLGNVLKSTNFYRMLTKHSRKRENIIGIINNNMMITLISELKRKPHTYRTSPGGAALGA